MMTNIGLAQRNQEPPPLPNKTQIAEMVEELDLALELTTGQRTQISELYFAHFEKAQKVMDTGKTSGRDSHQAMEALRKHFQAEVKVLLNKDQVKKFESLQKNHRPPQQQNRR